MFLIKEAGRPLSSTHKFVPAIDQTLGKILAEHHTLVGFTVLDQCTGIQNDLGRIREDLKRRRLLPQFFNEFVQRKSGSCLDLRNHDVIRAEGLGRSIHLHEHVYGCFFRGFNWEREERQVELREPCADVST